MNTITRLPADFCEGRAPVIPAEHPDAIHPTLTDVVHEVTHKVPKALQRLTAVQIMRQGIDIQEERAREYERPEGERSTQAIVTAFNAITGRDLRESEGWLFLQLLKNVRLFSVKGYHADSGVDGVNYAALMAEAKSREQP